MAKIVLATSVLITLLLGLPYAYGQKATEIFIPIGESPGLSDKYTSIGKIEAVDAEQHSITISDPTGSYTVKLTERTKIWLDRSKLKLTNVKGAFEDLQKDSRVEVKYEKNERKDRANADWVKVQVTR
ncbi:MAG: hypothetical protein ACE5HO_16400 [bacterium]